MDGVMEIKVGQIRKWKEGPNYEQFEVIEDYAVHYKNHIYIIKYKTSDNKVRCLKEVLLEKSVLCDSWEDTTSITLRELMELLHHLNLDKKVKIRVGEQLLDIISVSNASLPLDLIILETEGRYN